MIAELCFYRTLNFVDCCAKHNRVKLLNHLAWIEGSKITAPFSGRTGRVFLSECREICAICYLLLKLCTEFLILNQYVSRGRLCHSHVLCKIKNRVLFALHILPGFCYEILTLESKHKTKVIRWHLDHCI